MLKEQRLNFLDSFYESNTKANIVGYAIGTQIANAKSTFSGSFVAKKLPKPVA
jgi:hypothetical protein